MVDFTVVLHFFCVVDLFFSSSSFSTHLATVLLCGFREAAALRKASSFVTEVM